MATLYYESGSMYHHGIGGQKWGVKNGPPYPLGASDHSAREKSKGTKGWANKPKTKESKSKDRVKLTDTQKTVIKVGAAAVGVALATGLAVYAVKSGKVQQLAKAGRYSLPKDLGASKIIVEKDNCKDVAEATILRELHIDDNAIPSPVKTVTGNLHDFIEKRGYNKNGVTWIGGDTGIDLANSSNKRATIESNILKKCKNGDMGYMGVDWDVKKHYGRLGISDEGLSHIEQKIKSGELSSGHAFNFVVENGKVRLFDNQPDIPVKDAWHYIDEIDLTKEVEIVKITKEAFK